MLQLFRALALTLMIAGCAAPPLRTTLPSTWLPSPNFGERRPTLIVVHHTGSSNVESALRSLTNPDRGVSAHYLIGRNGAILQLVDERKRAWHAGDSRWGVITDVNSASIGIELDNNGSEPFPPAQIESLLALLREVTDRHRIQRQNVVGHADVAPARKADPSRYFPWKLLAQHGFGLWCDEPPTIVTPGFDPVPALQAIGYDVSSPSHALRAFRLHYGSDETGADPTERELALLACLRTKSGASSE